MTRPQLSAVSWNIDGLARALPHELARMHEALGAPDLLCLQEVRVRPDDAALVAAMRTALPGYDCAHALCDDPINVRFRGGRAYGVALYARSSLAARLLPTPSWDREGRVIAVALDASRLVVGNVYAVNGTSKPHFDHEGGVALEDRHAFKRAFQRRVTAYFQALRETGADLALLGDWNVSRTAQDTTPRLRREPPHAQARAEFNELLLPGLDVVDAFRARHPDAHAYTWFSRRSAPGVLDAARVDLALISRARMPSVRDASIVEDPALRFGSDHAPVRLALDR